MLWRRTAHTPLIPTTGPVPDTEALRRMLLQASWQRGLWVARRRVAVRWVLWSLRRYGLYLLLTAAAALYVYSSPDALSFLSPLKPPAPLKPAVQGLEPAYVVCCAAYLFARRHGSARHPERRRGLAAAPRIDLAEPGRHKYASVAPA